MLVEERPKNENTKNTKEMTRQTNRSPKSHIYSCHTVDSQSVYRWNCMLWKRKRVNRVSTNIGKARVHDPQKSYALEEDVSASARITYINLWKL